LGFSYLENNVPKGQEHPYLGISQRCDLERYSLDTVCQNTVHAQLCGYPGQSLYLAGLFSNPETVKMLNQNGMLDCSCLASTQEEVDTRIILHALYSDKLYQENNVQDVN
jgi:hypothetical protein